MEAFSYPILLLGAEILYDRGSTSHDATPKEYLRRTKENQIMTRPRVFFTTGNKKVGVDDFGAWLSSNEADRIGFFIESILQMCFEGKWLQNR